MIISIVRTILVIPTITLAPEVNNNDVVENLVHSISTVHSNETNSDSMRRNMWGAENE